MDVYQTEEQQIVQIKRLWAQYGKLVIGTLLITLLAMWGMRYYRHYVATQNEQASSEYQVLLKAMQEKDYATVQSQGELLIRDYKKTSYADLGSMMLAKLAVDENNLDLAKSKLEWIIDNNNKSRLWHIAKVRLSRILVEQNKSVEALDVLSGKFNGYTALYEEAKGDIYVNSGELDKAKESYRVAINSLPRNVDSSWLELKLKDLGDTI